MPSLRIAGLLALTITGLCAAEDWPQYRGPTHDGITNESISQSWPLDGPKVLWRTPLGKSFGSFAVAGGKACIFQEKPMGEESCSAFDAATGNELWTTQIDQTIHEGEGGDGPRSTPTLDHDQVYVYGTNLKLTCLDARNGKPIWSHDIVSEFGGKPFHWGNAMSPILEGDLVIVAGGGRGRSMLAFHKKLGNIAWKSGDEKITHATPVPATIDGVRQVVFFMQSGLVSLKADSGELLWKQPFPFNVSTAASPVVGGDIVYCSAGYGVGGGAYQVSRKGMGFTVKELWRTPGANVNHWTTPVFYDGYLYGLYGFKQFKTEPLKCVELATGKEKWSHDGFGQGGLILANGNLLIQGDQGQLVLAKASHDGYSELAVAHPVSGKCWTMPVVADGKIYCRSDTEGVCLDAGGSKSAQ